MIMFLDHPIDQKRVELATQLGISVIVLQGDSYILLNPWVAPLLRQLFSARDSSQR